MKKLGLLTLIFTILALTVGAVLAQDDTDREGRRGQRPPRHRNPVHRAVIQSLVEDTGLEPQEVREALSDHETTFADLITANGGDVDTSIADAILAGTEIVEQGVENERITRERADEIIDEMPERVTQLVTTPRPEKPERPERPPRQAQPEADGADTSDDA